jgi:hypothetical protein
MEETIKSQKKSYDWLKQYQFQKGNNANPNGRPKGKSLKEFAREFLMNLPDEDKATYLSCLPEDLVWKMAEGNPKQDTDLTSGGKTINVIIPQALAESFKIDATNKETGGSNTE